MKKSELIKAIKEALLPDIEKIVKKRVNLAAAQIIKESRRNAKPIIKELSKSVDTSLASLMNDEPTPAPNKQSSPSNYKKQTFIKGNIKRWVVASIHQIWLKTSEQQIQWMHLEVVNLQLIK